MHLLMFLYVIESRALMITSQLGIITGYEHYGILMIYHHEYIRE